MGSGSGLPAITTRPAKDGKEASANSEWRIANGPEHVAPVRHSLLAIRKLVFPNLRRFTRRRAWKMRAIKINRAISTGKLRALLPYTPGLSTWWSSTALKGVLVSRWVSRLDAFSGYPVRT